MSDRAFYVRLMKAKGQPEGHAEAWDWLHDRVKWYPRDRNYWPWRQAKRRDRWRPIAMVGVTPAVLADDNKPGVAALSLHRPPRTITVEGGTGPDASSRLASLLFQARTRRTSLVVPDGSAWVFDALLRDHVPAWVDLGYVVTPLVAGWTCKGMVVRKGRERWTLADFTALTGTDPARALAEGATPSGLASGEEDPLPALTAWVTRLQEATLATFGVYLRPTLPGTAVRSAGFDLPEGALIPRVPPYVVAMCRDGLGYRGGYVYGEKYRGLAWKVDARRLYARALCEPLGVQWTFGRCQPRDVERPGIYLCTVSGEALHPVQLGTWDGPEHGFTLRLWSGGTAIAILPSSEFAGLRAMGLTVEPGWGWVAERVVDFSAFVAKLQRVLDQYGSDSREGRAAKLLGNSLYGRLAVRPDREIAIWSRERPGKDAWPMVTPDGRPMADLWEVQEVRYSPSQQVGAAAMITGFARGYLYEEMARRIRDGASIVHAHTDGYVATGPVPADLPWETDEIGAWRLVSVDDDAIVARAGGYAIGGETKWSGAPHQGRRTVEMAWTTGGWVVRGRKVEGTKPSD